MAEYIEKNFALDVIRRTSGDYAAAFKEIAHATVADVTPVAHGRWRYHEKCMEAAIKKRILTEKTNRQIIENYVPVVHGRWRQDDEEAWTCTACGNVWTFLDGGPNENNAKYCPVCGAKMDGEGDAK